MNILNNFIYPALANGAITATVVYFGKKWLTENIKHHFDLKIKYLENQLAKENIAFQINTENKAKLKYSKLSILFKLLIAQNQKYLKFLPYNTDLSNHDLEGLLTKNIEENHDFQNMISETSPYLTNELKSKLLIYSIDIKNFITLTVESGKNLNDSAPFQNENVLTSEAYSELIDLKAKTDSVNDKLRLVGQRINSTYPEIEKQLSSLL